MALPHSLTIIDAVVIAFKGIKKTGGYNMDVAAVQKYDDIDIQTTPVPMIHVNKVSEQMKLDGSTWDVDLTLEFYCYLFDHEQSVDVTSVSESKAEADLQKAFFGMAWDDLKSLPFDVSNESFVTTDEELANVNSGVYMSVVINYKIDSVDITQVIDPDRSVAL